MKSVWSGKGKTCSPACRSLFASAKSREAFIAAPGTQAQRSHSHALVTQLRRSGLIEIPSACHKCFTPGEVLGHHYDYSKPNEVYWLCDSCHGIAHRDASILEGVTLSILPLKIEQSLARLSKLADEGRFQPDHFAALSLLVGSNARPSPASPTPEVAHA